MLRRCAVLTAGSLLVLALAACASRPDLPPAAQFATASLPPFPAEEPGQWLCPGPARPAAPSPDEIARMCSVPASDSSLSDFAVPSATITDLDEKNRYDLLLRSFLRGYGYRAPDWRGDQSWRLTGPVVGPFSDHVSYGVHPAVRVWYSPQIVRWLCEGRPERPIPDGAMIVKEMHPIDPDVLGIGEDDECMVITAQPDSIKPTSWTVMVRAAGVGFDGWYWANPTASGDGNPPILGASAVTDPYFFGADPLRPQRNPDWYPTGDLFGADGQLASVVTPYNLFGAYCLNCHASAESAHTFAALDNLFGPGLQYRHFAAVSSKPTTGDRAGAAHLDPPETGQEPKQAQTTAAPAWQFSQPLPAPATGFADFFGSLGPDSFADAFAYRLPAETFDHQLSHPHGPGQFVTSDQCIGCHDATVSNSSRPKMLIDDPDTGVAINVSPYAEWRASPMGLAGRDPIFFAQLQSETNHLPDYTECIETTCLHCHGVMGQRQLAIDTESDDARCKDLFAIQPPPQVPFGEPFRLDMVSQYQAGQPHAVYGNLARDGISCAVCHHVSDTALGTEASFTGNWVAGPADTIYGPYEDVIEKPMQNALGITPQHGAQIGSSDMCGSCHNILLPVFNNDGTPHRITTPDGSVVTASYEQTTHLEWSNSVFAYGEALQSCQDCHMPRQYKSVDLAGTRIANIESNAFAPTTHRLPDGEITLTPRETYSRHALHGLNLFLNEMFQQFPLLLGIRQIDYMGATSTQPALITAAESMQRMAEQETAELAITAFKVDPASGEVEAHVRVVNRTGHYLPSGVGFRRLFIEFTVRDHDDGLLWASGRSNDLGVILDGITDRPLATERGIDQRAFQPHFQVITRGDQVQIYQELIKDSAGVLTTSFLRRVEPVKDNRLRPKGFDPRRFLDNPSPFIQLLGHLEGEAANDPHYYDPALTGSDELIYRFTLPPEQAARVARAEATLFNQSIPPFYLQQRFHDATVGPAHQDQIRRLYYMTSHLDAGPKSRIAGWKLRIATAQARP